MLIRAPESWPHLVIAAVAMIVLAAIDLAGALLAKEAVAQRSPALAAVGVALFVALFWVYASSLQYADLAPVTFGWIVILQLGVIMLDRYRYHLEISAGKWLAIIVIIMAQAYLLMAPANATEPKPAATGPRPAVVSGTTPMRAPDARGDVPHRAERPHGRHARQVTGERRATSRAGPRPATRGTTGKWRAVRRGLASGKAR